MTGTDNHNLTKAQAIALQAHHEAAHAVIGHHAGIQVNSLHVTEINDAEGWHIDGITYVFHYPEQAAEVAVQAAAGEIAGLKWLDQHGMRTPGNEAAATADHDRDETLALLAEDGITVDWPASHAAATDRVDAFWAQIGAVAEAAIAQHDLTADEITEVIHGALDTHYFRYQHDTPEDWTSPDFETYENLAAIGQFATPTPPPADYQPAA